MHQSTAERLLALAAFAVAGGTVYGFLAVTGFILARFGGPFDIAFMLGVIVGGIGGAFLGVLSWLYILPLLVETQISRSITLVFFITLLPAAGVSLVHPLLGGLAAAIVQPIACLLARSRYPDHRDVLDGSCCRHCGYDLRGLCTPTCPECGYINDREVWSTSTVATP